MDTKTFFRKKKQPYSSSAGPLSKLKFYCQQCSKQCRDANALKQHNLSPNHIAKTSKLSSEVISNYNNQLTEQFILFLKRNGGLSGWSDANKMYNRFIIAERDHVHMVSTSFNNLSQFLGYALKKNKILLKKPEGGEDLIEDGEYSKYLVQLVDDSSRTKLLENEVLRLQNEKINQEDLLKKMMITQRKTMQDELEKEKIQKGEKSNNHNEEMEQEQSKPVQQSINLSTLSNTKIRVKKTIGKKKKIPSSKLFQ
ncbi:hypothetical protein QEN19_004175 [Hanseniaspora menglaensis]